MYLSDLTWLQARQKLNADTLILIPLGAAAKEHGPHLPAKNMGSTIYVLQRT